MMSFAPIHREPGESSNYPAGPGAAAVRAYGNPAVHARIAEFLGGTGPEGASAIYFTVGTDRSSRHRERLPLTEVPSWLGQEVEVSRSLWDADALLLHLDVEYVNFDQPGYPYLHAERAFHLQEPVVAAVRAVLESFGIPALHVLTGRGHHFNWRIKQNSAAFKALAELGHVPASLRLMYATERAPTGETVSPTLGAAFAGAGLVIEFIAHLVKLRAAPACEVPVELGAIEVGGREHGREMISVDITEYADPLCSRVIRVPFTLYLKPSQQHLPLEGGPGEAILPIYAIPVGDLSTGAALQIRHDPEALTRHALVATAEIPEATQGMRRLIRAYEKSDLARCHRDFYSQEHEAPGLWSQTYDTLPLEALPACTRVILERPNDLLLRPACASRVIRVLLSLGWHPRQIAGLIRSKYERDYGWGDQWQSFDPATRADFYARVFSGLFLTGADDLVDFNCQSAREEGLCFVSPCQDNLDRYRQSLLHRKNYERVASRPFNRLFLPEEHL